MSDEAIEAFFSGYSANVQAISRALRAMVLRAMPGVREVLVARQNHIGYGVSDSMGDRICYLCPMKDYVRLGFMFGGTLPDPEHLLEGEGKRLRHVKVRSAEAAQDPAVERLVAAAWAEAEAQVRQLRTRTR